MTRSLLNNIRNMNHDKKNANSFNKRKITKKKTEKDRTKSLLNEHSRHPIQSEDDTVNDTMKNVSGRYLQNT